MFEAGFTYILSKSLMNTRTIKKKSGNTMCSLTFFFVVYGFVGLSKIDRIEKVTVHPITFTAEMYTPSTKNLKLKQFSHLTFNI